MAEKKTLFVSDIHLGPGEEWDWFSREVEGPLLVQFFDSLQDRKDVKEIVLLGDVFDLWVCPHDEEPHTFTQIVMHHKAVIDAIKNIPKRIGVLYVNGNHDFRVTPQMINTAYGGRVKHIGNIYRRRNIYAEHGHLHTLFNRPDPKNGGHLRLPIGYFITRLHTSLKKRDLELGHSRHTKAALIYQIIDEAFQVMGPEKLTESILDALRDALVMNGVDVKEFNMGNECPSPTYNEVRETYQYLYEDWFESVGFWQSTQMILSELDRLGPVADDLCRNGVNIVVLGHSHGTKMDKDSILIKDRIYANCGYWCGFGEPGSRKNNAHYVETDGKTVSLYSFFKGKGEREESYSIDD